MKGLIQLKLIKDFITIKEISKKYPQYLIYLTGKILILKTQIEKKRIVVSHFRQLFKYQTKNFKKEFDKLKSKYLSGQQLI